MGLPKVKQPLFDEVIPSSNLKIKFRPFLVKEEKILLFAKQSGDDADIINGMLQVINNCIVQSDENFDINDLTTFDLEYLFLKIRAKSVNNIVEGLSFRDKNDGKVYTFDVDLDDVIMINTKADEPDKVITINDTMGIYMKYPNARVAEKLKNVKDKEFKVIIHCIAKIYDENEVYSATDYSEEELEEFLDNLDSKTMAKIKEFFEKMPRMYYKIEYVNELGENRSIELSALQDFFTLG